MKQLIKKIKTHGDFECGIYYPASSQIHPLPDLFAGEERIGISFYIEMNDISFFVEENPGNINGSVFDCYCDINECLRKPTTDKVKSVIINNHDAIKVFFHMVDLTAN